MQRLSESITVEIIPTAQVQTDSWPPAALTRTQGRACFGKGRRSFFQTPASLK